MTRRDPPQLPLALLEWLAPGSDALAGDLIEAYEQRPSDWRLWREVFTAVAFAWWREPADEIRPLRLTELQPADAVERSRRYALRRLPLNIQASPLNGIGGLPVAVLLLLMTLVMPAAWWFFVVAALLGLAMGVVMIRVHSEPAATELTLTSSGRIS